VRVEGVNRRRTLPEGSAEAEEERLMDLLAQLKKLLFQAQIEIGASPKPMVFVTVSPD